MDAQTVIVTERAARRIAQILGAEKAPAVLVEVSKAPVALAFSASPLVSCMDRSSVLPTSGGRYASPATEYPLPATGVVFEHQVPGTHY